MKQKRYWLRGLLVGIAVYVFLVLYSCLIINVGATPADTLVGVVLFYTTIVLIPIMPFGLLIGWIYGKIKNRKSKNI